MTTPEYTLGLDIGIASVGAALINSDQIIALHVRTFEKAETAKEGESLNKIRREARGKRRTLRRRVFRLSCLRKIFVREGLWESNNINNLIPDDKSPWQLRAEGLQRRLSKKEWAIVIYHIVKHRGFQSNRKSEIKTDEKAGKMLSGVKRNQSSMAENGYKTVGEMIYKDTFFSAHKRNKSGDYTHTISREDLERELFILFAKQRDFGNVEANECFEKSVHKWLMARRPTLSGNDLINMVGYCSFEKDERRIPKACYRFERFSWLQKLNNLKIVSSGETRTLTDKEKALLKEMPFNRVKLTYKQVRKKLSLDEKSRFNLLSYRQHKGKDKDPETATLFEAKAFHALKKAYQDAGLKSKWDEDVSNHDRLDLIAYALTCYKSDSEISDFLAKEGIESQVIEAVLGLSFDKFGHLSQKAIIKLIPSLEKGKRYDEAAVDAGYNHSQPTDCERTKYLPKLDKETFRNPVVYRAVNQTRKLINAIIKQYGSPKSIHIELARDLSYPFSERKKIEKAQGEFRVEKEKAGEEFERLFGNKPRGLDLQKLRLYREQDGKCAYTQKSIDLNRLPEAGFVEIDHALPFSRSFDNSQNNKVLTFKSENQNKANKTPFEYFGNDENSERWRNFEAFITSNPKIRQAKRNRLLRKHFGVTEAREFRARNLNDTRYISKAIKNMLENQLQWHPSVESNRCVVVSGQLTSLLRARWGLLKVREDGDLHHALDAAVVAACSQSFVKRMANYSKRSELEAVRGEFIDVETGEILNKNDLKQDEISKDFPMPWDYFRVELLGRLSDNPKADLANYYNEEQLKNLKPIRVSRMATRRGTGSVNEGKIRSIGKAGKLLSNNKSSVKTPLNKLKMNNLKEIVGADDPRNKELIDTIKQRLLAFSGDGSKAFAEDQPPLYRPSKNMQKAPIVRSVKLLSTQKSGIRVRKGIAKNGDMLRIDIFKKNNNYFVVPIYCSDLANKSLPNLAVIAGKPESEWTEMNENYEFCFTFYSNDWIKVINKKQVREGYFSGLDRATGAIELWVHDRDQKVGRNGLIRGIGIKTAISVEKFHVDLLGNLFKAKHEPRQSLKPLFNNNNKVSNNELEKSNYLESSL